MSYRNKSSLQQSLAPSSWWITGPVRSGKTTVLVEQLQAWIDHPGWEPTQSQRTRLSSPQKNAQAILVLAANANNRTRLVAQLTSTGGGSYPITTTTPLGFFETELILFWPLLAKLLNLKPNFPLRLRPETEQALATQLWQPWFDSGQISLAGDRNTDSGQRQVRQLLDLMQLAAFSGTPVEAIPELLQTAFAEPETAIAGADSIAAALEQWRDWCLERGLLTYGILTELYWRYLLPHPTYRQHLSRRYRAILADDVDNYPAIARELFDYLLDQGAVGAFTYNPLGAVRLGLGADPDYLLGLRHRCQGVELTLATPCVASTLELSISQLLEPWSPDLPETIYAVQTSSRAQLLRQIATIIIKAIEAGQVAPQEIAVIGPGLDAIARYSLSEILAGQGIAVTALNHQCPLNSSPMIRALLTLLAFLYPGAGRLIERDQVAEMLVVLSQADRSTQSGNTLAQIDPVRAGLLADYCFKPDPEQPQLLPVSAFPRWDRLGYVATTAYEAILSWLDHQKTQQTQRLVPSPVAILDRAIEQFLWPNNLAYDQLAQLRELIETAQHYWEIEARLGQAAPALTSPPAPPPINNNSTVSQFIQLLRRGTITANPFPANPHQLNQAVTLATTFQYRTARQVHRWHFWLDASSPLWQGGGRVEIWGAPVFLKQGPPQAWTAEATLDQDHAQLQRLLVDLLSRAQERVYLCHSDLAVSGQEQVGPLLPLVEAAIAV